MVIFNSFIPDNDNNFHARKFCPEFHAVANQSAHCFSIY